MPQRASVGEFLLLLKVDSRNDRPLRCYWGSFLTPAQMKYRSSVAEHMKEYSQELALAEL